jgi:hypothetical protein
MPLQRTKRWRIKLASYVNGRTGDTNMPKNSDSSIDKGIGINEPSVPETAGEPTANLITQQKLTADKLIEDLYAGFIRIQQVAAITPSVYNAMCNGARTMMKYHESQYRYQLMLRALEAKPIRLPHAVN